MSQEYHDILSDPFAAYSTPRAVLDDGHLPTATKLKVLTAMEMDLVALQSAEGENMGGDGGPPARLSDVRAAIRELDPNAEAHGEVERLRREADSAHAATLSGEQARQGERLFDTGRQRNAFTLYIAVALALFAVAMFVFAMSA